MDKILLEGLVFFGRHGCHAAERELGQKFTVDIRLECDLSASGASDDLVDTVDYVPIYNAARDILEGESVQLLETLAERIAVFALQDPKIASVWVRIKKPHIALSGTLDFLGVEITRGRKEHGDAAQR